MLAVIDADEVASSTGIPRERVTSMSVHAPSGQVDGRRARYLKILAVVRDMDLKIRMVNRRLGESSASITLVEEPLFRRDCAHEELGGAAAHLLLIPYTPLVGEDFLRSMERMYFRHISLESLRNLILDFRLSSNLLVVTSNYILYDKLRRISTLYPPSRIQIQGLGAGDLEALANKLEDTLRTLASEGLLVRNGPGYSPSSKLISEVLSEKTILKSARDLEHVLRLYLAGKQNILLDFVKSMSIGLSNLSSPRLPNSEDYLYTRTGLGLQPLSTRMSIEEFVRRVMEPDEGVVKVRRFGGILNATYIAEFTRKGEVEKVFVKKYFNWSDFKWVVAWLWTLGVSNFSVLATTRMSNEIYFINKLSELGFHTAEVLHVNWKDKIIFQKFIEGENTVQYIRRGGAERLQDAAEKLGRLLADLHGNDVSMGDCNPFSFLFTESGDIYLTDLEQCSMRGLKPWDITELVFYTANYLPLSRVEEFAYIFSRAYLEEGGRVDDIRESIEYKYVRIITPITPIWIQSKVVKGVTRAIKEKIGGS